MSKYTHTISSSTRNKGARNRMGSRSKVLRAVANYLKHNPPSTVHQIVERARFKNGKLIRNSNAFKSPTSLGLLMYRHRDFFSNSKDTRQNACLWNVKKDSDFLKEETYKQVKQ
tara:strand:+ start:957 stop:1298 length:342 start_codon:yes stop_codon:yes gene_type:complete